MDVNTERLRELSPLIFNKAEKALKEMKKSKKLIDLGVTDIYVNEGKRQLATQMAYYSRGRMAVDDVKKMYKAAGLYTPTDTECKTKNTNTLESKHLKGQAVDIVPMKDTKIWWDAPDAVWEEMGRIGKSCGLYWGGDWIDFQDKPHYEV